MKDCEWAAGDFDLSEGFDAMKDFEWTFERTSMP